MLSVSAIDCIHVRNVDEHIKTILVLLISRFNVVMFSDESGFSLIVYE